MHFNQTAFALACVFVLCGFDTAQVRFDSVAVNPGEQPIQVAGVLTLPSGKGPFPAAVLLPACAGLTDTVTSFWPNYLAQKGYASLAVDSLSPRGMRICMQPGGRTFREVLQFVANDAYGALQSLSTRQDIDKERIAVVGFSLGGIAIAQFASRDFKTPGGLNFKAAVTLYAHCSAGALGSPPAPGEPKFPWLIVNGEKERESNHVACRQLAERRGVSVTLIEGAYHAFDDPRFSQMRQDPTGNSMLYSPEATRKAQALMGDFLGKQLTAR